MKARQTKRIMMLRLISFFILLISLTGCTEPPYTNLNNEQLKPLIEQGIPIYDIRRPDEWKQTGVIEGSRLLTFVDAGGRLQPDFLPQFVEKIGKNDPVILICRTGNRTSALANHLIENMGYTNIYNVQNGITRWLGDGLPVTRL